MMVDHLPVRVCHKCRIAMYWVAYPEWGGIWVHMHNNCVWCERP